MKHFNYLKQLVLLPVVMILAALPSLAQLNGTYTVGGTSPNYTTLTAAVADLNTKGVSGPVTFNLRNGTYNEKVIINDIVGASATNRITFKSETNNSNNVTVTSSGTTTADAYIFRLAGSKYITIKHLTLHDQGGSYATAVDVTGDASYDSILNSTLKVNGYNGYNQRPVQANGVTGNTVVFKNDSIMNGYFMIYLYGNTGASATNYVFDNNVMTGNCYYALYHYYTTSSKFNNNLVNIVGASNSCYPLMIGNTKGNTQTNGNNVTVSNVYLYNGMLYMYEVRGNASNPALRPEFKNNTLTATSNILYAYANYVSYCDWVTYSGNTWNMNTGGNTIYDYLMYYYTDNFTVKKNTFNMTTTGSYYNYLMYYYCNNNVIDSNTFNFNTGYYYHYSNYPTNYTLSNNTFNMNCAYSSSGINIYNSATYPGAKIFNNNFIATSANGSSVYGLRLDYPTNADIYNNVIRTSTSSSSYGAYIQYGTNVNLYNNTIHSGSTSSSSYAAYIYNSSSSYTTSLRNNVFSTASSTSYPLYIYGTAGLTADYNNIYSAGTNIAQCSSPSVSATSLQAWRTGTGRDLNSISYSPGFISGTNLAPDPTNAASWSLNGRGVQIAGNNKDILGNNRSTTLVGGVPDIGAYEFTPTATPPANAATPASPVINASQYFTFGQDTTVVINWGPAVPSSISVRQYTGTLPAGIAAVSGNNQYYYTDINVPSGTYDHTSNIYYKDPWMYTVSAEPALRLAKKDGTNPWAIVTPPNSTVDVNRNIIKTTGLTTFGFSTGVDAGDNAGAVAVVNPVKPFCAGTIMVQARIKNSGNNTLNSVQVNWSVDGVLQTPLSYTTPIPTLGSGLGNEVNVNLGNVTFANAARVIKVWTSAPNGGTDGFTTDDTISTTLRSSLGGIYTIGGTTPDYPSIASALTDLYSYGVCSAVTFNLRNGTYNAQAVLKPAMGMSAVNTVTFKSETNTAANVTIEFNSGSSNNYIFKFDSGSHYRVKLMTLKPTNSTYGRVIEFTGTASNDSVSDNLMPITATTSSSSAGLYVVAPFRGVRNTFSGNTVTNGYYGIYLYGSSSNYIDSFDVIGNTFVNPYYSFAYTYYTGRHRFNNNTGTRASTGGTFYTIYRWYARDAPQMNYNNLSAAGTGGLYLNSYYVTGDPTAWSVSKGNTFTQNGTSTVYNQFGNYHTNDSLVGNTMTNTTTSYIYNYRYGSNAMYEANNTYTFNNNGASNYMYWNYYWSGISENNTVNYFNNASGSLSAYTIYNVNGFIAKNNTYNYTSTTGWIYNYMYYNSALQFLDNKINFNSTSGAIYGMYHLHGTSYTANLIKGNVLKLKSTGLIYGIYSSGANDFKFINNVVSVDGSTTSLAVYNLSSNGVEYYNNTFVQKTAASYVANFNSVSTKTLTVKNNIFYNAAAGGGVYYGSTLPTVTSSDFNNVFVGGTNKFVSGNPAYTATNLQDWRVNTGQDKNSILHNPGFTNPSADNYAPNPGDANSWSLNGRGEHIGGNNVDINGNTRVTSKAAGVPDIGAYEFTPTAAPPSAAVTGTIGVGNTQVFTLGQDTVAVVEWDAAGPVPSSIDVKQYSGMLPPPTFVTGGQMYIYTDIIVPAGTYPHKTTFYYKDPQTGTTIGEGGLRMVKKVGTAAWTIVPAANTATDPVWNKNRTVALNDFGFHTLTDVPNNAAAAEVVDPVGLFCAPANKTIKVKIKNQGNNIINTVQVGWKTTINGVTTTQTPVSYTTPINILGSSQGNEAIVTLGNYNFTSAAPVSFVVYTYSPNGVTDPAPVDDTSKFTLRPGLNGVYTIGGTTPDFPTIDSAITDVNLFGICGPVTFNIRNGNYTIATGKRLNSPIQGGSVANRVTFQSESGNAQNVIITGTPTNNTNNYVFGLQGVSDVTLKKLKIVNTSSSFSHVVDMSGAASRDSIVDCVLQAPTVNSYSTNNPVLYANPYSGKNSVILRDSLKGGAYGGIYMYGSGTVSTDNVIDSNIFVDGFYYGAYIYYMDGLKFRGNTLVCNNHYMAAQLYYCNNSTANTVEVAYNKMLGGSAAYGYSMYIYYMGGNATRRIKIHHNTVDYNTTSYTYGFSVNNLSYGDVYENTIKTVSTYNYNTQLMSLSYNTYMNFYNNRLYGSAPLGYVQGLYSYTYSPSYSKYYNNVVSITASPSSTSASQGWYMSPVYTDTVVNNTINLNSGNTSSPGFYIYTYDGKNVFINNVVRNMTGGPAMYWSDSYTGNISDYNNLYTSGNSLFTGSSTSATLQAYRTATNRERNSLSYEAGFVDPANDDLHPDPANPNSWSVNGRGIHFPTNNVDIEGNPRVTALADGVPDLGAYEFVPTSTPPLAVATPAVPAAGTTQVFTFGQDTVAAIRWKAATVVPGSIEVRQYSGAKGPAFPAGKGFMYFYTDMSTPVGSYDAQVDMYYKDPWRGIIPTEPQIRSVKQLLPNAWAAYNGTLSATNTTRNFITTNQVNDFGYFSGITDGDLFSSIILPGGSLVFCPGGSVTLNANVSGTGYTHQWKLNGNNISGATNATYVATQAGTYTLEITGPSQSAVSNPILVTIVAPPSAQITSNTALTFCPGGNLTLNVGTGPLFSYQWALNGNAITGATAPSYQVQAAGSYTVTVKNIGCSTTSAPTSVSAGPMVVNLGSDTSFCQATPLVLDAGFKGAKYLWNTGDTTQTITIYNQSGLYTVQVDAGPNCADADTINVQISPLPGVIGITYNKFGSTYQFSPAGATNVNSYLWLFSDGGSDTAKNVTHTFSTAEFEVKLIVFNDCGTDTAILQLPLDVSTVVGKDIKFSLYPNPAQTDVTLSVDGDVLFNEITIVNNLGQVVHRANSEGRKSITIDVNKLIDGHYLIRANMSDGTIITKGFDVIK